MATTSGATDSEEPGEVVIGSRSYPNVWPWSARGKLLEPSVLCHMEVMDTMYKAHGAISIEEIQALTKYLTQRIKRFSNKDNDSMKVQFKTHLMMPMDAAPSHADEPWTSNRVKQHIAEIRNKRGATARGIGETDAQPGDAKHVSKQYTLAHLAMVVYAAVDKKNWDKKPLFCQMARLPW